MFIHLSIYPAGLLQGSGKESPLYITISLYDAVNAKLSPININYQRFFANSSYPTWSVFVHYQFFMREAWVSVLIQFKVLLPIVRSSMKRILKIDIPSLSCFLHKKNCQCISVHRQSICFNHRSKQKKYNKKSAGPS